MNFNFNLTQISSGFVVLYALIDVLGSVPIFLSFKDNNKKINPLQSSVYAFVIMLIFLFVGSWLLKIFQVDESSFAIAGAVIIFIISVEMVFGVEIFRNDMPNASSTFVPIVFPLIAGPATFTALLSMRAKFDVINIITALFINMVIVFVVLRYLGFVGKILGKKGIYVLRKFFGIILMAISLKMFVSNLSTLLHTIHH